MSSNANFSISNTLLNPSVKSETSDPKGKVNVTSTVSVLMALNPSPSSSDPVTESKQSVESLLNSNVAFQKHAESSLPNLGN